MSIREWCKGCSSTSIGSLVVDEEKMRPGRWFTVPWLTLVLWVTASALTLLSGWSLIIPYQLPPSIMIHGILSVQFMYLTVFFHNLSPSLLWSTSWPGTFHFILHTFLHQIIVFFSQQMPIPSQPFCCSTEIMSSNPSLSLNPLLGTLSCSIIPCIHLTIFKSAR